MKDYIDYSVLEIGRITLQNQLQILLIASITTNSNCCQTRLILLYFL